MPWQIVSDPDTKCYTNFNAILWATSAFTWTVNCLYCIMLSLSQYLLFTVHCSRCFAFVLRKSLKSVLVYNNPILDSRISFISNIWMQKSYKIKKAAAPVCEWELQVCSRFKVHFFLHEQITHLKKPSVWCLWRSPAVPYISVLFTYRLESWK